MTLYKWMLERNGRRATAALRKPWSVAVGEWTAKETPVLCESGWHGVEEKDVLTHLPYETGAQLWEVEVKGKRLKGDDKFCAAQMRLVRLVGVTTEQNLRLFACDCAEDVLHVFEEKYPDDNRPRQAIEVARRFANGEATREELNAAVSAARLAYSAAYSAYSAARSAADSAYLAYLAYSAADSAARSAAYSAADSAYLAYSAADLAAYSVARSVAYSAASAARQRYSNWLVVRLESGY